MSFRGRKDLMFVKSVSFEMNKDESQDLLVQDLKNHLAQSLRQYLNQPIWKVRLDEIRKTIMEQQWVENAQIKRRLPNQISIELTPKRIVSVVRNKDSQFMPLYYDGSLGEAVSATLLPDVPLLIGDDFLNNLVLRQRSVELLASLPIEGHMIQQNIKEIEFDKSQGFIAELYRPETQVVLGIDQYSTKIKRIENVLAYMEVHDLQGRVIDATFSKKVLVRLRKGP